MSNFAPRSGSGLRPATVATLTLVAGALAVCLGAGSSLGWPEPAVLFARVETMQAWQQAQPLLFCLGFFALFTTLSALAIPGCCVLALAAGACFGWLGGTLMVVVASTCGATLSFLAARHLWRDAVVRRFGERLEGVERRLARDGARYLFTLRVAPVIPYPLVNPLLGLSRMPTSTFFVASALGMTAGSAVYAYAGTELAGVRSMGELLSAEVLASLTALALLPWAGRLYAARSAP